MRCGMPAESWGHTVTLYEEAPRLVAFLGERGRHVIQVVLRDSAGTVAFFHVEGYSGQAAARLAEAIGSIGRAR